MKNITINNKICTHDFINSLTYTHLQNNIPILFYEQFFTQIYPFYKDREQKLAGKY